MQRDKEDEWVWKGEEKLECMKRFAYNKIISEFRGEDEVLYEKFWKNKLNNYVLCMESTTKQVKEFYDK